MFLGGHSVVGDEFTIHTANEPQTVEAVKIPYVHMVVLKHIYPLRASGTFQKDELLLGAF